MNTKRRIVPFPTRHVNDLIGQGYTPWGIARAAGIGTTTMHRGMNSGHCAPITRARIYAVDPATIDPQPAWRATRRIRALAAAGVRYHTIAAESGLTYGKVAGLAAGHFTRVSAATFARLDAVWEARKNRPVTAPDPRVAAKRWAVPWEWDDIDDYGVDVNVDTMIDSASTRAMLERAIERYGDDAVMEALGVKRQALRHYRTSSRVSQSRAARTASALYRLDTRRRVRARGRGAA